MDEFRKDTSIFEGKGESDWDESKHPRDEDGKFTNKGGDTSNAKDAVVSHLINTLKKVRQSKTFEQQIDEILNGTYLDSHIMFCENTPNVFQEIGVANMPFLMTTKHAYLVMNEKGKYDASKNHYHGLGKETFMLLPRLLKSPIMILQPKGKDDELVVLLNKFDKDDNLIIVPLKLNGKGNKGFVEIDANIVKSAYGKKNIENYLNTNFTQEDILMVLNKKIRDMNTSSSH